MRLEKQEEGEMENLLDEIPHAIDKHDIHHGWPMDGLFDTTTFEDPSAFHRLVRPHRYDYGHDGHACTSPPLVSEGSLSGTLSPAVDDRLQDELRLLDSFANMSISGQPMATPGFLQNRAESYYSSLEKDLAASHYSVWGSEYFLANGNLPNPRHESRRSGAPHDDPVRHGAPHDDPVRHVGRAEGNQNVGPFSSMYQSWVEKDSLDSPKSWLDPYSVHYPKRHSNFPMIHERMDFIRDHVPWSPHNIEYLNVENSLIIQGEGLHYVPKGGKVSQLDDRLYSGGFGGITDNSPSPLRQQTMSYDWLIENDGCIDYIAKDQHGCRFLQRKIDEGSVNVDKIFKGIVRHVAELMVNPFGNYLMQKFLDVCNEEQRMGVILELTEYPNELVRISLNIHGTRAVQKLIETLKTRQQITLVVSALQPGFLELIKDLNGNHVVQRCLQSLLMEDNKFIFDAAARHCVEIATHRHGCCVLQRCISHSAGDHRVKLIAEVSANGLLLAQDPFGNYVVQFVLDLKNPLAIANLASQFKGNYVYLSTQKFSSNVVEKCLKVFGEDHRAKIIIELLQIPRFEQLVQDPYANYVIQSALVNSKGSLHTALVEAIRPHASVLRTSPYCKRIFSRTLLKK